MYKTKRNVLEKRFGNSRQNKCSIFQLNVLQKSIAKGCQNACLCGKRLNATSVNQCTDK